MLFIITAAHNDGKTLHALVARVHKTLEGYQYELIIEDDTSSDGTAEVEDNLLALAIDIGIGLIWNFSRNKIWTWRKSEVGILTHP